MASKSSISALCSVVLLALAGAACTLQAQPVPQPAPGADGPQALETVQRLIAGAACDHDAQCHSLPLGARACGGPDRYLAWSSRGTDAAALQEAARQYTRWQARSQRERGLAGICVVEVDPGAVCRRPAGAAAGLPGQCVLGDGRATR